MDYTLEKVMDYFDKIFHLENINIATWLSIVATFFLALTVVGEVKRNQIQFSQSGKLLLLISLFIFSFVYASLIYTFVTSYYYNFILCIGIIVQIFMFGFISFLKQVTKTLEYLIHANTILLIFIASARWIVRGVDAEETSADTLDIYYDGNYEFSRHAGWYDLAPVDSILKVILLEAYGNKNPYSSYETFLISFLSGLSIYLAFVVYIKKKNLPVSIIALVPVLLLLHPYAPLTGLHITPTNLSIALSVMSLLLIFSSNNLKPSWTLILVAYLLYVTSLLSHPFAVSTIIFYSLYLISRRRHKQGETYEVVFFLAILILWIVKMTYTAAVDGVSTVYKVIIQGLFSIWERDTVISFRNISYAELPKLSISSFSATVGILGGIVLSIILGRISGKAKPTTWRDTFILIFGFVYGLFVILAALGGYSRYVLTPFASLVPMVILLYMEGRSPSSTLKILLTLAAFLTVISPNFMPDQYSIDMAHKITDETSFKISRTIFQMLDEQYIVSRFKGTSTLRLYLCTKTEYTRSINTAGLIVDFVILRGIIETKSYWDFVGRGPVDFIDCKSVHLTENTIFDTHIVSIVATRINNT